MYTIEPDNFLHKDEMILTRNSSCIHWSVDKGLQASWSKPENDQKMLLQGHLWGTLLSSPGQKLALLSQQWQEQHKDC